MQTENAQSTVREMEHKNGEKIIINSVFHKETYLVLHISFFSLHTHHTSTATVAFRTS